MSPWVLIRRDFDSIARQLQLVLALAVRAQSQAGGVSKTNAYINVLDAFTAHVLPEIQVPSLGAYRVFLGLASYCGAAFFVEDAKWCVRLLLDGWSSSSQSVCTGCVEVSSVLSGLWKSTPLSADACAFLARKLVAGGLYLGVRSMNKPEDLSWLLSRRKR